jgi:hypothetical protein
LGGKTKQEWSLDIAIQGLTNICKAKRASHAPKRFAQGLEGRMNSQLEVMTNTLQEWIRHSTASAARITRKSAGQAAAVVQEEEADEEDEGPVELTGAYKGLKIDIKRLKDRLRYFSKRWEIRSIAICEEDRIATELRKAGASFQENQEQTVTLNCCDKKSQKKEPGSNGSEIAIVEREASQYAVKTHDSSASSVTVFSAISDSLLQEAEVEPNLLNCDYGLAEEELRAGQYLNRVTKQGLRCKVITEEKQTWYVPVVTAVYLRYTKPMSTFEIAVYVKLAAMSYRSYHYAGHRIVFDPGGTQPGRH